MANRAGKWDADEWTETEARRVLAARSASGLSIRAYAFREGLRPQRLYWWMKRLAKRPDSTALEARVRFVPAVVNQVPARGSERTPLVMCVGSNARLEIADPNAVSAKWIAEVLIELERIACS